MKFFAVFAALVAVACGSQTTWTLSQLSAVLENPATSPSLVPHLEDALNQMMAALMTGNQMETITVTIPAASTSWSLAEIDQALSNPNTDPALIPYLETALNEMMHSLITGAPQAVTVVGVPAMDVTHWTLAQIDAALSDPTTDAALVPYLEHALNDIMSALFGGNQVEIIAVALPAGILDQSPAVVAPSPVDVISPIPPSPVEVPAAPSSPLVQIIVNINQQQSAPGAAPAPVIIGDNAQEIKPTPVIVVDQPIPEATPVIVVDQPIPEATPVVIVDQPIIAPSPVIVVDQPDHGIIASPVIVPPFEIDATPVTVVEQAPELIIAAPVVVAP